MALSNGALDAQANTAASTVTYIDSIHFNGDGSYPTGGTAGFTAFYNALYKAPDTAAGALIGRTPFAVIAQDCGKYKAVLDVANDKLKILDMTTGNEVANATNLSATVFNLTVIAG